MQEDRIEIPALVAAIALMSPAFAALAAIVFGICFSVGLPTPVPLSLLGLSAAAVRYAMTKAQPRRFRGTIG
jgi:hypothetical protein